MVVALEQIEEEGVRRIADAAKGKYEKIPAAHVGAVTQAREEDPSQP